MIGALFSAIGGRAALIGGAVVLALGALATAYYMGGQIKQKQSEVDALRSRLESKEAGEAIRDEVKNLDRDELRDRLLGRVQPDSNE